MIGARRGSRVRQLVVIAPYLWLILFFLVPFLLVLKISFRKPRSRNLLIRRF